MARSNVDYEFITNDEATIESYITNIWETLTGRSVHAASPEKLFIQWMTAIVLQLNANINYAANQNIPSRAEGENLDALGELFYDLPRPQAKHATVTVRFHLSEAQSTAVLITSGTRVTTTDGAIVFAVDDDAYVPIGETYVDVSATCSVAGKAGNGYAIGTINTCVDEFLYYGSVENITISDGGTDIATDDEYYDLLVASQDSHSTAGAKGAYIYWAKQVSNEILDICVNSPSAGTIAIYAVMQDGTLASQEIKNAILESCSSDSVRPLTDHVTVADCEVVPYAVNLKYYITEDDRTHSAAEIETSVRKAVDEYTVWQASRIGRDINPSRLIQMVIAAGAKRVDVTSPVFTSLRSGIDNSVPQLGQCTSITIVNGGYEDD